MRREKDARLIHFFMAVDGRRIIHFHLAEFRHRLLQMFPGAKQARLKRRQRDPQLVGQALLGTPVQIGLFYQPSFLVR